MNTMNIKDQTNNNLKIIKIVNPVNGNIVNTYKEMSQQEALTIVDAVHIAFQDWRKTDFKERSRLMIKVAELMKIRKEKLAKLMTEEMGKVNKEAISEIEKCIWSCEYYAEKAASMLADEEVETDMARNFVTFQPIGVVLAVMPWNFPFWQVFRFAVPALMAGNGAVLKHSSSVSGCALEIEDIFKKSGFPENLIRTLLIDKDNVESVIAHRYVRAVTLTGSTCAGRIVASQAGKYLKKTVLELGGSDAYIILEDADIDGAAEKCTTSRLINGGQSCIAAKRFIVIDKIYDQFIRAFKLQFESKIMGDPNNKTTDIGPQASEGLRNHLHDQVQKSIEKGAKCILGGKVPDQDGAWYPPTILTDVAKGMPAYDEELFGPVASVIKAKDVEDAITISNSSDFGLGGAVFTKDIERGIGIARNKIECGLVALNDFVKSDLHLPFGGVKDSGYGRELSYFGIREFVNCKAVSIK